MKHLGQNEQPVAPDAARVAELAALAADEKKAREVVILDVATLSPVTDFFVICHGGSGPQVKAIADNVEKKLTEQGFTKHHSEGYANARWILLDFGDVLVHVFHEQDRDFYNLERLWADARLVRWG